MGKLTDKCEQGVEVGPLVKPVRRKRRPEMTGGISGRRRSTAQASWTSDS